MAMDTPAKIAILGAGPIGLEAALYARFLGYDVEIFERGEVADHVRRWGHVRMFSPFHMNATPLGLAALHAQDESYQEPPPEAILTGRQWHERYLTPLSQTDLLVDHLRLHTAVIAVSRRDALKYELAGDEDREESPFRLLLQHREGQEWECTADLVIDTTGVWGHPNWLGPGGAPALGERQLRARIRYDLPDILGVERARFANRRVLVVGSGYSAATNVVALSQLAAREPATRVVWCTRRSPVAAGGAVVSAIANDPLPERTELVRQANAAIAPGGPVGHWPATTIQSLVWDAERLAYTVTCQGQPSGPVEFDEILANVGYQPDRDIYAELQVHECYATGGPMKLAAKLLATPSQDCLQQSPHGPAVLINPEPHFYILGAKSYGRKSNFLVSLGHQQIRELFSLIGEREDLDLYRGAMRLQDGRR